MSLDPVTVDLIKWVLTGMTWVGSVVITYVFAKREKVDDLRIRRRHELVEKLSVLIQEDHQLREVLRRSFESNFSHLGRKEAYEAFDTHESLYQGMRQSIERCAETKAELDDLAREIAIYISERLLAELQGYLSTTTFTYMTDGYGLLINTYAASFFENLLDKTRAQEQREAFTNVMKGLRNVKH